MEIFRSVKGYEGLYWVSNKGTVRRKNGINKAYKDAYYQVRLWKNKQLKTYKVHKLMAQAFLKGIPGKEQVVFLDGDNENLTIENLKYMNRSEKQFYCRKIGKWKKEINVKGIKNSQAKLNDQTVLKIRDIASTGNFSQESIGGMFGICQQQVSMISRGKAWVHLILLLMILGCAHYQEDLSWNYLEQGNFIKARELCDTGSTECLLIKAESYAMQGDKEKSDILYHEILDKHYGELSVDQHWIVSDVAKERIKK